MMEYIRFKDVTLSTQYGYTADETSKKEGTYKYLRITDIVPYFVNFDMVPFCSIPPSKVKQYLVSEGDILIARTGATTGYNYVVQKGVKNAVYASYLIRFNVDKSKVLPSYMKYVLKSNYYYGFVNNYIGGSAQPGMNARVFGRFNIPNNSLPKQHRIASILSAYDNLIENNNKRIRLLEQMAENLYKEWFVRFRFPGHKNAEFENGLPKGWRYFELGDRYDITIGKTPPRKEFQWFTQNDISAQNWMSISDMKDMFTGNTSEQLTKEAIQRFNMVVVPEKTILLSFKLTVGRITIATQPLCTNEAIAHIKNVPEDEHEFLYQQLKNYEYAKLGNTSAIGNAVNSKIIKRMEVLLPNEDIILRFHKKVYPIFEQIKLLSSQNETLARQRDLLLPRLMSGKLEVNV